MDVILGLLECDPAHAELTDVLEEVLRIGVPFPEGHPLPRTGDVIYLENMELTVFKTIHNWNDPGRSVTIVAYPDLPIHDVEKLYWELHNSMGARQAEKLPPRISWVAEEW